MSLKEDLRLFLVVTSLSSETKNCSNHMIVQNGWVSDVIKYLNKYNNNETCDCKECLNSPTPKTQFAHIQLLAPARRVYVNPQRAHAKCHLLIGKDNTPSLCRYVVTLSNTTHVRSDIMTDLCEITFVTHDLDLADRLDKMMNHRDDIYKNVSDKNDQPWYKQKKSQISGEHARHEQPLCIIVSHPHGCSKTVSIGHCVGRYDEYGRRGCIYNTPTCAGSSGACVFVLGKEGVWLQNNMVHSGSWEGNKYLNHGSWEGEVNNGGEVDLFGDVSCEKHPGHLGFIPIDQVNVNHLPRGYRDNDLVEYIRAQSDVTVRISVKCVSDRIPKTYPGSDKPYPCYSDRDRCCSGTGWIYKVQKHTDDNIDNKTCTCKECLISPVPKTQFALIHILTATHVVYDDLEAALTTCHLFFDRGRSPETCNDVVKLSGMTHVSSDIRTDWCKMIHVTHNLDLADRLDKMVQRVDGLNKRIRDKYNQIWCEQEKKYKQPLQIGVCHLEGCRKHDRKIQAFSTNCGNGRKMFTCTMTSCPGFTGAIEIQMGVDRCETSTPTVESVWGKRPGKDNLTFYSHL